MFSGIIEEVGSVTARGSNSLKVGAVKILEDVEAGDSISVNGVCLTAISFNDKTITFEIMPETLKRSNLGALSNGDKVNLERALKLGDRIGGHIVQGHIDDTVKVLSRRNEGQAVLLELGVSSKLMRYIAEKGFIALDGASLTIAETADESFTVSLVGYTLDNTRFDVLKAGDVVNLEVDITAKYIEKIIKDKGEGVSEVFLKKHGFMVK
jgi:riboflavin synthase